MKHLYLLLLLAIGLSCKVLNKGVKTQFFKFFGHKINVMGSTITEYLGIPYAHPPMHSYRFKPPVEIKKRKTKNNYYAVHLAGACPQIIKAIGFPQYDENNPINGTDENCLKFNMWVPKTEGAKPILVILHGGSYTTRTASADRYNGSVLAATTNSIVITPNFRLGFFGFAYLKSGVIPGNLGLLDQQVLLKWIHRTIKHFGGDKYRVTVFGTGSGSACVAAHLLSEGSKPYFKRAIMSSETITHVTSTVSQEIADANTRNVSKIVGCEENVDKTKKSDEDILGCLQTKSVEELLNAARKVRAQGQFPTPFPFMPINNDNVFFKGSVKDKMKTINKDVDLMAGRTADEATIFMATGFTNNSIFNCRFYPQLSINDPQNACNMDIANFKSLVQFGGKLLKLDVDEINKLYDIYDKSADTYTNKSIRLLSDFIFDCELSKFAIDYSKVSNKNVYFYEHAKRSPIDKWPAWTGATHNGELLDIFGIPFRHPEKYPAKVLEKERLNSKNVMTAFGNFIRNGIPSPLWKKVTTTNTNALIFDGRYRTKQSNLFKKFRPPTCDKFDQLLLQHFLKMKQKISLSKKNKK